MSLASFVNKLRIIKQLPCFSSLSWFDRQKIVRKAVIEEYKKGVFIYEEGQAPDAFYCLVTGRLQVSQIDNEGNNTNIDFIHRGQHFGIISVLTGENHSVSYETLNDSVILKIAIDDFQDILKAIPSLGIAFSQSLSRRIRRRGERTVFESKIISIYSPTVRAGVSTYAINLALSLQKETKKKVILVNISSSKKERLNPNDPDNATSPCWKNNSVDLGSFVGDHESIMSQVVEGDLPIGLLNVVFDSNDTEINKKMSSFVTMFVGDFHYVIVDLPNKMDEVVQEVFVQSDLVHIFSIDRKKDLEATHRVIDDLQKKLYKKFQNDQVQVVVRQSYDKAFLPLEEINKITEYDVYKSLPLVHRADLQTRFNGENVILHRVEENSEYVQTIRCIAREVGGVRIGLVLGGGAALGLAHIGVLRILERNNIPIDMVVGSSMGALVGAIWSVGYCAEDLEVIAREFQKKKNMLKLFDPVIPISGFIGGRLIKRWLYKYLGDKTFYSTKVPFKAVAYDLTHREEIVINSGSLVDAVRQSIAIPGVIEPICKKEKVIIDGGVLNPLPTNVLANLGITRIIAVNVLQSPEDVSQGVDIEEYNQKQEHKISFSKNPLKYGLCRLGNMMKKIFNPNISDIIVKTLQASEYVIAESSGNQANVLIHPNLVSINWYELNRVEDLVKAGEDATLDLMDQINALANG